MKCLSNMDQEEVFFRRIGSQNKVHIFLFHPTINLYCTPPFHITLHIKQLVSDLGLLMCVRKKCCAGERVSRLSNINLSPSNNSTTYLSLV